MDSAPSAHDGSKVSRSPSDETSKTLSLDPPGANPANPSTVALTDSIPEGSDAVPTATMPSNEEIDSIWESGTTSPSPDPRPSDIILAEYRARLKRIEHAAEIYEKEKETVNGAIILSEATLKACSGLLTLLQSDRMDIRKEEKKYTLKRLTELEEDLSRELLRNLEDLVKHYEGLMKLIGRVQPREGLGKKR
ncbi:hypothetical protein M011DRAFT_478730 [Sporormia fimetaria CBS 119925]|uniref:Uncharacterized protein n=1 Tax=Sporormia fimetaria CBS 119925 TaxID=1340428 RepID=A0A6A6V5W5_9PLEO|nr:hypothetical protein M011DRAFT_478730 [Sporormia fimetaria CBS 119925]